MSATETEFVLHQFVRDAVARFNQVLETNEAEWELESQWDRGTDGQFRERVKRQRKLWLLLAHGRLQSIDGYKAVKDRLNSDQVIGNQLDRLIGSEISSMRIDADNVLWSAIHAMRDDDGSLVFSDEKFDQHWSRLVAFFIAQQLPMKTVVVLPYLSVPEFPLSLGADLEFDRLSADEVTRCCLVGILRPPSPRFPLIGSEVAVGIRRVIATPKTVGDGRSPGTPVAVINEGSFGKRPVLCDHLLVDDVLSALRLFKQTRVRAAGYASWCDSFWVDSSTSSRELGHWPYGGQCELAADEVAPFRELWKLLAEWATPFSFSIHRFNLAFDRTRLDDRIVDLVIAAESLFLGDTGADRGELRFRFALRAAKFIQYPRYTERDVYRVMRRAYDARSAIVHGGSAKDTALPTNSSATVAEFADVIEDIIRHALRKTIEMKESGRRLRDSGYWDELLLEGALDGLAISPEGVVLERSE